MYRLVGRDTVEYSEDLYGLLKNVNTHYNKFQYIRDQIQFNELDHWTALMDKFHRGDCDDYTLSKRKKLMEEGVPYQCLFPTICTVYGEGHLVLVVRTSKDDLVLDNISQFVEEVARVNYSWYYRLDPESRKWLRLY